MIIYWTSDQDQLIPFDTELLLTYKVMQGKLITLVTFEATNEDYLEREKETMRKAKETRKKYDFQPIS